MLSRWTHLSDAARGTILLLFSMVFFTIMLIVTRLVGQDIPVAQLMFVRGAVMQVLLLIMAGSGWRSILRTRNLKLNLMRSGLSSGASGASIVAVVFLPLALATALSFSYALFVTIGAALILRETVSRGSWIATLVGLGGVILMLSPLQPGGAPFIAVALVGAILSAGMVLSIRGIDPDEPIATVLTYQFLPAMPILAVPTILFWTTPTMEQWLFLVVIGVSATIGQWLLILAFQRAGAAKLAPLDFVRLILMTACGLAFFGETVSVTLGLGMLVVVLTTVYTVRANTRIQSVA